MTATVLLAAIRDMLSAHSIAHETARQPECLLCPLSVLMLKVEEQGCASVVQVCSFQLIRYRTHRLRGRDPDWRSQQADGAVSKAAECSTEVVCADLLKGLEGTTTHQQLSWQADTALCIPDSSQGQASGLKALGRVTSAARSRRLVAQRASRLAEGKQSNPMRNKEHVRTHARTHVRTQPHRCG